MVAGGGILVLGVVVADGQDEEDLRELELKV